jgi:hypothetical protein
MEITIRVDIQREKMRGTRVESLSAGQLEAKGIMEVSEIRGAPRGCSIS